MYSFGLFLSLTSICLTVCRTQNTTSNRTTVTTSKGQVIGWLIESRTTPGKYMRVFKGIPFAKPPIKDLRFKNPVPIENWSEPLNLSISDPNACAQPISYFYSSLQNSSEDCLFINVFSPQEVNSNSLLPVMVFIYGGAFITGTSGSTLYGPDYLVDQGVIYVSFNYRLSALGFLNLGTADVPGNAGLKDQRLALQWVQKEIGNFGGDPSKVTLFGESAGAASVILLYLSPITETLFKSAIAESGNALAEWPFLKTGYIERSVNFSTSLNCTQVDGIVNLTCLQNVKVEDIISNQVLKLTPEDSITKGLPFVPSLEKPSTNAILSDTPENLLTSMLSSTGPKRSLITGINRDEGLLRLVTDPNYYAGFYTMLKYFIPEESRKSKTKDEIEKDVALIKTQYFNNTPPSITNLDGYIKLLTDRMFGLSTAIFSRKISQVATVYLYHFEFSGLFNIPNPNAIALNITNSVGHADELGYIFYIPPLNQSTADASSTSMTTLKRMVKMWTNFAKTGNPTPDGTTDDDLNNIIWTPATNGAYRYFQISSQLKMSENNFEEEAVVFWNKIQSSSSSLILSSCAMMLISIIFLYIFR